MQKIKEKYEQKCNAVCDINEHIPTLHKYSLGCEHITEMGTREITSTWAFLGAKPKKFVGIDVYVSPNLPEAKRLAEENDIEFEFLHKSTLEDGFVIEPTDFLFIDTAHTYAQLSQELARHAGQVKKYIGFHDTTTYGFVNEPPYKENEHIEAAVGPNAPTGLRPAITEFVQAHPEWKIIDVYENNNGLTIMERKGL
jgi:hypothetical protein